METNQLYCGDNLSIMQDMPDASVDLICTDPPFNTGRDWGEFNDKWEGGLEGYLKFMKPRCEQMHRLLKDTGSLYLHCDPTASHYLKVMLDTIFGIKQFRNEIVWRYQMPSPKRMRYFSNQHNIIFWFTKTDNWVFNVNDIQIPLLPETIRRRNNKKSGWNVGQTHTTTSKPPNSVWNFGNVAQAQRGDITGYPTQKPVALYARMIVASSNQGDVVLDPFCGSGTTLVASNNLSRYYIGIDKNPKAIEIAQDRLKQLNLFTSPNDEVGE